MHPQELFALEAIVMPQNRPVVFVRGQSYDNVEHPWEGLNGTDVKARISALFPSIGRVEVRAVIESPPAAPVEERRGPVMSLDQYLHQRDAG